MDSACAMPDIPAPIASQASVWPCTSALTALPRPLMGTRVSAGFPSPAADYMERELDIAALLITNPPATYFVRIEGNSMAGGWIRCGDIVIVDCSVEAKAGMVVVAVLDGEMVIKELGFGPQGEALLIPRNGRYKTITVNESQDFTVWGVVTWALHRQLP
jgi:DNA polymerase V